MNPRILFITAFFAAALVLGWVAKQTNTNRSASTQVETSEAKPATAEIGGEFTLVNTEGQTISTEQFKGKIRWVYFGFTSCPAVCPTDLANISHVLKRLGKKADNLQVLFITVDPERDTPEVMKKYMESYDPRIMALTGTAAQIATAAKAYKVYYKKMEAGAMPGGYTMDHSAFLYVMDREGKYLTHFGHDEDLIRMEKELETYLDRP